MAVLTGYSADIYIASGTGTSMTGEAVTSLGSGVYQITNAAKRAIDPNSTFTVLDGVSTVPPQNYQVGWASGKVTFTNGYTAVGTITVTGKYLTMAQAAQGFEWSLNVTPVLENTQTFGDSWQESTVVNLGGTVTFQQFVNDGYFFTNNNSYFILYLYPNLSGNVRWMTAGMLSTSGITAGENEVVKQNVQFTTHGTVDYAGS